MTTALFRQEVLEAKRSGWLGSISLAQPAPVWVLTVFASGAALSIVLFLVLGSYTRRAQVSRISRSALNQSEWQTLLGSAMQAEPPYRVTVQLAAQHITAYGKPEPLKSGMVLEADILDERRRLIEWVSEPLYSLKERIQG